MGISLPSKGGASKQFGALCVQKAKETGQCDICSRTGAYLLMIAGWVMLTDRIARDRRALFCTKHTEEMVSCWDRKGEADGGDK